MNERVLSMLQGIEPDYHPLISILKISADPGADLRLRFDCHRTIARYVEPELRTIEIKPKDDGNLFSMKIDIAKE